MKVVQLCRQVEKGQNDKLSLASNWLAVSERKSFVSHNNLVTELFCFGLYHSFPPSNNVGIIETMRDALGSMPITMPLAS
jgi:hypothetical protein